MDELVKTLQGIGYTSNPSMTLTDIIANCMQDEQYSLGAREKVHILSKYGKQYGNWTVAEIMSHFAKH